MKPTPHLEFETTFWRAGLLVAGLDEVGRGAWAGPVVAGAVVLPLARDERERARLVAALTGVRDSKQLTPRRRETLSAVIRATAWHCAIGLATNEEIDALGIVPATRLAMKRAVEALPVTPSTLLTTPIHFHLGLLIDALVLKEIALPQKSIIHGDQTSLSIAAASILAKVTRDQMMREFENDFPGYALARHKGYGTALHRAALEKLGVSPLHRRSFKPVANLLQTSEVSETSEVLESKP